MELHFGVDTIGREFLRVAFFSSHLPLSSRLLSIKGRARRKIVNIVNDRYL